MENSLEDNLFVEYNNLRSSLRSGEYSNLQLGSSQRSEDLDMGLQFEPERCHSPSLENLFSNKDVLARRLKNRPDRDALIDRHIIPAHSAAPGLHDKVTLLERKKTGDILQKKIRARPSRQQLIQRHILTETHVDPSLLESMGKLERQRITDSLNERLQSRPGPIELIQEGIIPVDSPIKTVLEQSKMCFEDSLSPSSYAADSPNVADLESGITTLNCTSPSPPLGSLLESGKNQFQNNDSGNTNSLMRTVSGESHASNPSQTPISLSQKENEKLVRTMTKKSKAPKTKVKKLKFHECRPPEMVSRDSNRNSEVDQRYKKLLEQQTLYLRLQVLQQNAMMNVLQGNTDSVEAFTDEIEEVIRKEKSSSVEPQTVQSIDGKKLDDLRVIDLRVQLKQRGLLVSGTKAKLIERLSAYAGGRATAADFSYSSNNALPEDLTKIAAVTSISNVDGSPSTTVMQVTTYATSSGQTYQVIQAVPEQSQNVYQVVPTSCVSRTHQVPQIQLNHINIHPVVEVTQPHVMMIEDAIQSSKQKSVKMTPPSSHQVSQRSVHSNPSPPTILIHSIPQLQKASLLHHEKPKMQTQSSFRHSPYQTNQGSKPDLTSLSPSSTTSNYNRNKYIISPTKSDICQQLSGIKTDENQGNRKFSNSFQPDVFQSRTSPELHHSFNQNKESNNAHPMKQETSDFSHRSMENQSAISPPGFKLSQQKHCETVRRETVEDIMDIIGELPSPNAGSPLMSTSSSPNIYLGVSTKLEYPPPYNSCAYSIPKTRTTSERKCLNVSPQNKLFSSVPENINTLGCNQLTNNLLSSPYGSLSPNSFSGSLNSNLSGSLTNLQGQSQSSLYNSLNHSLNAVSVYNHFSSTGSIPQQVQSDNYQRLSSSPLPGTSPYGTSPNTTSNYLKIDYRAVSPMTLPGDNIPMELDHMSSSQSHNNNLSWLDLNMETNSPGNIQYQNLPPPKEISRNTAYYSTHNVNNNMGDVNPSMVYSNVIYANNPRTQNTLYSGDSRLPDACISLFDLDNDSY